MDVGPESIKLKIKSDTGLVNDFMDMSPKAQAKKSKNKWGFCIANRKNEKAIYITEENVCQLYIWWGFHIQKYIRNYYNSIAKKVYMPQLKNEQRMWTRHFSKKVYEWSLSMWEGTEHHLSLGECKSKL